MELPDIYAARGEAYASADDLAREALPDGTRVVAWAIIIADQVGNILDRVKVTDRECLPSSLRNVADPEAIPG